MIKAALLVRLLKQRLSHNEAWLEQDTPTRFCALKLSYDGDITEDLIEGHRRAVGEEVEFLRVLLKEVK